MRHSRIFRITLIAALIVLLTSAGAWAHCDTENGPVVKAGRQALERRDVRYALIWVRPADEAEIRTAFERTLLVRVMGDEAKALADRYFFETLVRVHRAGEGAPYTGVKAGGAVEPGIAAAERALEVDSVQDLSKELTGALQKELEESFRRVESAKNFKPADVEAGRLFVARYIGFIHYIERLHRTIESAGSSPEAEKHDN